MVRLISHLDLGLTTSSRATHEGNLRREDLTASPSGLIRLFSKQQFESKLQATRDSWLVFYFHNNTYSDYIGSGDTRVSLRLQSQLAGMDEVAQKLHGAVNVAAMDLSLQDLKQYANMPTYTDAFTGATHYTLPFMKLHRGDVDSDGITPSAVAFEIDMVGVIYTGGTDESTSSDDVEQFVYQQMEAGNYSYSSMLTASKSALDLYDMGIDYLR